MNHTITQTTNKQLIEIKETIPSILEDYKKYFIFFNKNPEVDEYQQMYANFKSIIQKKNSILTDLGKETEKNIILVNKNISIENKEIDNKKTDFKKLILGFEHYQDTLLGAEQMIDDFKILYNNQYYVNIQKILGIILVLTTSIILLKKK
jgi:hypothetical protein